MKFSMTGQRKGDLLIQVTAWAWAGLTVLCSKRRKSIDLRKIFIFAQQQKNKIKQFIVSMTGLKVTFILNMKHEKPSYFRFFSMAYFKSYLPYLIFIAISNILIPQFLLFAVAYTKSFTLFFFYHQNISSKCLKIYRQWL
jgi:hypothetical protein